MFFCVECHFELPTDDQDIVLPDGRGFCIRCVRRLAGEPPGTMTKRLRAELEAATTIPAG